jgi:5'-methylthioadenosine phosphorylase
MRALASASASSAGLKFHDSGSVVVINGPRFSTKAESKFYGSQGFDTINMTQYPEVTLAREREICYLGIGIVTDYDVGLEAESGIKPVSAKEVSETFAKNIDKVKKLTVEIISRLPEKRTCECAAALSSAMM